MMKWAAGLGAFLLIGFALWLGITRYGQARYDEGRATLATEIATAQADGERNALAEYQRGIAEGQEASLGFIRWREGPLRTIKETINHETILYRQSAAGGAICLDPDGLRAANQSIAAINHIAFPADPGRGDDPLPESRVDPAIAGWQREPSGGAGGDGGNGLEPLAMRENPPDDDRSLAQIP
jgi:hypothetical protein